MIDTDKYEEIMKHGWEVNEQLFVSGGKWRFAIEEYTQTDDMSKEEIEEWEEGLEPLWDALLQYIADAPLLLEEVKRLREQLEMWKRWFNQGADNKMEDGDVWDIIFHQSENECLSDCEEYEDSKCWNCETKKLKEMIE